MNRIFKIGFTLIEVMISTLIIFITFILVYRTFFTIQKNMLDIQKEIKNRKILFNFLSAFKSELDGICDPKDLKFDNKEINFTTFLPNIEYPVEIKYIVESKEKEEKLIRIQKNILTDYEFKLTVLKGEMINFLFFVEDDWKDKIERDVLPKGIAIEINYNGEKIFYPIHLNFEKKNEKK
ncbi:MAG: hypothetical protein NC833_01615 [Candidatus Omnitrophica bacterium]|nr:hypothetical protein [Candidatus Omnitrophota bacterium]